MSFLNSILDIFNNKDIRLKKAKLNILFSFVIKGIGILISFLIVPLTLNYLNISDYGVWLTLSSLLTWINYFDIGLSNGLRNKLAESLALKDFQKAQIYVSTTFAMLGLFMLLFFISFLIINPYLDWNSILNVEKSSGNLNQIILVVFGFFCVQFVFRTVGTIFVALQKPALSDLLFVIGSLISLIVIYILTKTTEGSLFKVALVFSSAPILSFFVAYLIVFYGKYSYLRPKLQSIRVKYVKDLVGLGLQFFIIQIAVCIVVYTSSNIIIAQYLGAADVTVYNIAYKYFFAISMGYNIIIMPFWSATTDAFAKNDNKWIEASINKLVKIFIISLVFTILMIVLADWFYLLWVGNEIKIPLSLSIYVALYVTLYNWTNTFNYFINGIGKIRLQLYVTVIVAIVYIPIAIYLVKIMGLNGVVIATCLALVPTSVLMPIQTVKLYKKTAKGIWNK